MTEQEYRRLADAWGAAFSPRWGRRDQQGHTGEDVAQGSIDDLHASQGMDRDRTTSSRRETPGVTGDGPGQVARFGAETPGVTGDGPHEEERQAAPGPRVTIRAADSRPTVRKTDGGTLQPVTSPAPVAES